MVDWRTLEAGVDGKVNATFGEQVRLSFLKSGAVDPDRDAIDMRATLYVAGDQRGGIGASQDRGFVSQIAAGEGMLVIDLSTYTGAKPQKGDLVRATDRAGQPWFEVAHVDDRFTNLLRLALTQA